MPVSDNPPRPLCDDCNTASLCRLRDLVCRDLVCSWLEGVEVEPCPFYQPDDFHGLEGVRA